MAGITYLVATYQPKHITQSRGGAANEIPELRVTGAYKPPHNTKQHQYDNGVAKPDVIFKIADTQPVGDERANDGRHQRPVKHANRQIPDFARLGLCWRLRNALDRCHQAISSEGHTKGMPTSGATQAGALSSIGCIPLERSSTKPPGAMS